VKTEGEEQEPTTRKHKQIEKGCIEWTRILKLGENIHSLTTTQNKETQRDGLRLVKKDFGTRKLPSPGENEIHLSSAYLKWRGEENEGRGDH